VGAAKLLKKYDGDKAEEITSRQMQLLHM